MKTFAKELKEMVTMNDIIDLADMFTKYLMGQRDIAIKQLARREDIEIPMPMIGEEFNDKYRECFEILQAALLKALR